VTLNITALGPDFTPDLETVTAFRVGSDTTGSQYARKDHIGAENGFCGTISDTKIDHLPRQARDRQKNSW
jgi:hypothetical protein